MESAPVEAAGRPDPRRALWALVVAGFLVRLYFIRYNAAETPDGYTFMFFFDEPLSLSRRLPLYPLLIRPAAWLLGDPMFGGRLVSLLAAALVPWPLYLLTRRLAGPRAGLLAGLLWSVFPVANRWAFRVMADDPYTLLLLFALTALVAAHERPGLRRAALASAAITLAGLTRQEGIYALTPLLLIEAWRARRHNKTNPAGLIPLCLLPPAALAFYYRLSAGALSYVSYTKDAAGGFHTPWDMIVQLLYYFRALPVAASPPLALLLAAGLFYGARLAWKNREARPELLLLGAAAAAHLVIYSIYWFWSSRYLIPVAALLLPPAAALLDRLIASARSEAALAGWAFAALALAWGLRDTALAVAAGRDRSGEALRISRRVAELPEGAVVYASRSDIVSYHSGRPVRGLRGAQMRVGVYLVVCDAWDQGLGYPLLQKVRTVFDTTLVAEERAVVYNRTWDTCVADPAEKKSHLAKTKLEKAEFICRLHLISSVKG